MKRINSIISFIMTIFLVSCISTTNNINNPIHLNQNEMSTPIFATNTAAVPLSQRDDLPTKTAAPTAEKLTPTPTFTPEISAELATLEAIVADKPELQTYYDRLCITEGYCSYVSNLGLSPNKEWAVFFTTEKGTGGLSLVHVEKKITWTVFYRDLMDFDGEFGCDCVVAIAHWSQDGRYVYVSPQTGGDGGLHWFWQDNPALVRIDLEDGTWVDTNMGLSYAFSPDDQKIVFRRGQNIVLHTIGSGSEEIIPITPEIVIFGRFIWSPDGKNIAFIGSTVKELMVDESPPNGFSLFLLDINTLKLKLLLENDTRYLYPLVWEDSDFIVLESMFTPNASGYLETNNEHFSFNLISEDLTKLEGNK